MYGDQLFQHTNGCLSLVRKREQSRSLHVNDNMAGDKAVLLYESLYYKASVGLGEVVYIFITNVCSPGRLPKVP